jgi:hypothetical protein
MAREGADISISYLPEEQEDAEGTKRLVEAEKRTCLLLPGDLSNRETCRKVVEEHIRKYVSPSLKNCFSIRFEGPPLLPPMVSTLTFALGSRH